MKKLSAKDKLFRLEKAMALEVDPKVIAQMQKKISAGWDKLHEEEARIAAAWRAANGEE